MDRLRCIASIMHIQQCGVSVHDLETSPMRWPTVQVGLLWEGGGEEEEKEKKKEVGGGEKAPFICCRFELTKNW